MAYTTADLVREVLTRDSDITKGTAASMGDDKINENISDAASRVDSSLAAAYDVPFDANGATVPAIIAQITRDIAAYLSDLTYRQSKDYSSERDPVYLRYQDAVKLLAALANGTMTIPGLPEGGSSGGITVVNPYAGDMFTPDDFDIQPGPRRNDRFRGGAYYGR